MRGIVLLVALTSFAAQAPPPLVRIWTERGGSQADRAMTEKVLDNLRGAFYQALTSGGLMDQKGKKWTIADLKGKTTILNLWYASCGPCRLEMPYLEKLHSRIKDRSDMQVVTVNVDRDANVARRFLAENHYTFPVLLAWSVAESADGIIAPATWILDAGGNARLEDEGFAGDGDRWVAQTLKQMESVRWNGR